MMSNPSLSHLNFSPSTCLNAKATLSSNFTFVTHLSRAFPNLECQEFPFNWYRSDAAPRYLSFVFYLHFVRRTQSLSLVIAKSYSVCPLQSHHIRLTLHRISETQTAQDAHIWIEPVRNF